MTLNNESGRDSDPVESAMREFHEAWSSGRPPDAEEFCKRHPECGEALRRRIEDFLFITEGISDAGQRVEDDEGALRFMALRAKAT